MTLYDLETACKDHFSLFGLPRQQGIDIDRLDTLYRDIQAQVHPDKHAHLSSSDKRLAMQWTTQVNEAYQTLKDPLKRARYLLDLTGYDARLESNTAMPAEFLVAQMELREAVTDAREAGAIEALDRFHRQLRKELRGEYARLQLLLDAGSFGEATALVRQLMFQEKLFQEIDEALAVLEA
jgi:molecular chaperone HscB